MATLSNTITPSNVLTATNTQTVSNKTFVAPVLGTPVSGNFSTGTFTWPTFNQNTTGSAATATTATTATNQSGGTVSATSITDSGNLTFTGVGNRIIGDFSNATVASRVLFQTSTVNERTNIGILPNGTGVRSDLILYNSSDTANNSFFDIICDDTRYGFSGNKTGTGTYLPMIFYTGGSEQVRISSTGSVVVSSSATYNAAPAVSTVFHVMSETAGDTINHVNYSGSSTAGSGYGMRTARGTAAAPAAVQVGDRTGAIFMGGYTGSAFVNTAVIQSNIDTGTVSTSSLPTYMSFLTTPNNSIGRLERVRITSEGSVGVGTTTPGYSGGANRRYISIVGNGDSGILQLSNSVAATGNNGNIEWIDVGNTSSTTLRNAYITSGSSGATANNRGSFIALATKDDGVAGAGTERLRIDSLGNIGIGTGLPDQRLTINSANTTTNSLLSIKQGDVTQAYVGMGTDNVLRLMSLARPAGITVGGANYIFFNVNGSERARIDASGAISFGSTGTNTGTAGQLLQSAGSAASPSWITVANSATITASEAATANQIVLRNASGDDFRRYGFGSYFNSSDDVRTSGMTAVMGKFSDNYYRSGTAAAVATFISGQSMNIAGTATALSSSNYINRTGSSGNLNTDFNNTPAGSTRIQGDDAGGTNGAGNSWWFYQNMRHSNGTNYWGTQVAWGWEDNANRLATRNVTSGSWGAWVYYLNSSNVGTYALPISGGSMTGLIVGKISNTVDINAANDAGSISVRGDTTYPAVMSFHRGGAYAINVGLSTANNFVIGGWSASSNAFVMSGGGALTMLNNITAYSDERVKTNWRDLRPDFIERLAEVKHGIYDRTDQVSTQVGVSAQSLQKILEQAVMENTEGHLSVAYGNAALVAAVKLAERVVALEARIAALEVKG